MTDKELVHRALMGDEQAQAVALYARAWVEIPLTG